MSNDFAHLHVHSQYSLLDGAIQFETLIPQLKKLRMKSCAITDHGWMGGIIEFYKICKKNDIKSLLGIEAYITEDSDNLSQEEKHRDNLHVVIIAKDIEGLKGLYKLSSEAALHNFYYKPRIERSKLATLAGHVVITTACLKGVLAGWLNFSKSDTGEVKSIVESDVSQSLVSWYSDTFKDDFYLEIQDWDDETHIQSQYNKYILDLAKKRALPVIITSDCHYLTKEDFTLHRIMMAMQLKMTLSDYLAGNIMKYGPNFYLKSPEEMIKSANKWNIPEATKNTILIEEKCNVEIELGIYHPPVFNVKETKDYNEFLKWQKEERKEKVL